MLLAQVQCPQCGASLRSRQPVPAGKKAVCPQCRTAFVAGAPAAAAPPVDLSVTPLPAQPLPVPASASPAVDLSVTPLPAQALPALPAVPVVPVAAAPAVPVELPASAPQANALRPALIVGAAVAFVSLGIVLAVLCFSGDDPAPKVAQAGSSSPFVPSVAPPESKPAPVPPPAVKPPAPKPGPDFQPVEPPQPKAEGPQQPEAPKDPDLPPQLKTVKEDLTLGSLPADLQARVNTAIDRGVKHLKTRQLASGTWPNAGRHEMGYAALPGLTLLECGVPASDPAVQKAAKFVRSHAPALRDTYHLSLAILFLDRLGEPKDKQLIRSMALRLIASQNANGGWTYTCEALTAPEEKTLLTFLQTNRPKRLREAIPGDGGELLTPIAGPGDSRPETPGTGMRDKEDPKTQRPTPKTKTLRVQDLPARLRSLPVVVGDPDKTPAPAPQPPPAPKGKKPAPGKPAPPPPPRMHRDDNSNTQFAIMALWAARRHDVPMERTLALIDRRFRTSQNADGTWGYTVGGRVRPDTMTCVGLIGLAMAHGADNELFVSAGPAVKPSAKMDDTIQKGLKALGGFIEQPRPAQRGAQFNAYLLWSVERVGVLYGLKTIGKKDWYRWGVEILLPTQDADGSWNGRGYPGASPTIDTCMALLFLKRANLTQDLTDNLRLHMAITDPDAHR